ncbi:MULTISPECIES: acyl-ACP thioesterase domain-containing protein [Clostridium]|uniref:acyl-[acyl-carrier-protein] thioesterase n=1 Tax=Clostridium TaxID=1485 RepID=UPI0002895B9C|nr:MULTISPECIES: acyl-ACP thioesterase domain-containing protein [Clostridium]MDF2503686.1 acyl-ACP thioesterase [Clostridium sp.]
MKDISYEKSYRVHHYEADRNGRAFVASFINYFEDLALNHSESLDMGINYLLKNNIAWVVYKWDIKINKYAMLGEILRVRTWAHSVRRFYAYRKYEIINSLGEVIATANSLWFMININRRRPCKIKQEIWEKFGLTEEDNAPIEFEKLREPTNITEEKTFYVRYSDIDTNKHVNNVKYVSWALETVSEEILNDYKLKQLKIDYDKETAYGEAIKVFSETIEIDDGYIIYTSLLNSNGEKLSLVKTIWSK